MNTSLLIYLWATIGNLLAAAMLLIAIIEIIVFMRYADNLLNDNKTINKAKKIMKTGGIIFIILFIISILIPSKETIGYMIAGTILTDNNTSAISTTQKTIKTFDMLLDKKISELTKDTK